ncbi:sugar transferase [Jeotgalibacillus malaysiensis]|uniref:Sugar transferase n=1 Tax=Jeotgalibacillus malaysiensis TaxID=1508404 RepID=A0A0B5AVG6_9BACL|nr:sugar transferase [Jeotgalibacillus malaysiensis]AJD92712.1 sugar transferase [Jeotgalibacillus malaysiensis]
MKRLIDLTAASVVFILLSPLFLTLYVLIKVKLGSPVLFKQERAGLNGTAFTLYKFRTMTAETDGKGELLPDEERLTPFGNLLRELSLDELPQLINVFKGDMSLVGPRPLLIEYLAYYTPEQMKRHLVKPGITGWAQIHGRNTLSWEEKFKLDTWYVKHISTRLDLKILLMTIKKVVKKEGISQEGYATVEKFSRKEVAK